MKFYFVAQIPKDKYYNNTSYAYIHSGYTWGKNKTEAVDRFVKEKGIKTDKEDYYTHMSLLEEDIYSVALSPNQHDCFVIVCQEQTDPSETLMLKYLINSGYLTRSLLDQKHEDIMFLKKTLENFN